MSINSDKLAHVQVLINCRYFVAQSCTSEGGLTYISGAPPIDDVMSYNSLPTKCYKKIKFLSYEGHMETAFPGYLKSYTLALRNNAANPPSPSINMLVSKVIKAFVFISGTWDSRVPHGPARRGVHDHFPKGLSRWI